MPREKNKTPKARPNASGKNKLGVVYDARMTRHQDPVDPSHPEQPARISRIFEELTEKGLLDDDSIVRLPVHPAAKEDLLSVHTNDWVATCLECSSPSTTTPKDGGATEQGKVPGSPPPPPPPSLAQLLFMSQRFDSVFMNQASIDCALLSAGATVEVTTRVVKGDCRNGIAVVRPPGHHAEAHCAKGFCFFNNVAVACAVATRSLGVKRVLVVDWDVHHGNGTQHMFEDDPSVLFFSVHRHDQASFYPNSVDGDPSMCGAGRGKGFNANVAWNSDEKGGGGGFGDADYLYAWEKVLLPLAKAFQPELTVISAGFDAARGDPLGGCDLTPQGYAHLTKQVMEVSPEGKVVLVLEGGYNLDAISSSFAECVRVLKAPTEAAKKKCPALPLPKANTGREEKGGGASEEEQHHLPLAYGGPLIPCPAARRAVRLTCRHLAPFWGGSCLSVGGKMSAATGVGKMGNQGGDNGEKGGGGGTKREEVAYATKPVLIGPGVFGRAWALCFNGQKFSGRLHRFSGGGRRGRRRRMGGPWVQKMSFRAASLTDSRGKKKRLQANDDDDDSLASEEANGNSISGSDSSPDSSFEDGDGGKEGREISEEEERKVGNGSGGGFNFNFDLPPGVELVNSTDSFTPFSTTNGVGDGALSGSEDTSDFEDEDEEAYWAEYFKEEGGNVEHSTENNADHDDDDNTRSPLGLKSKSKKRKGESHSVSIGGSAKSAEFRKKKKKQ